MLTSIIIVILAFLFGSLSIVAQYTKNRERRRNIESAASIPAGFILYGTIAWLMSHANQLDDLGVSPLALWLALAFFLVIPSATYIFSPAYRGAMRASSTRRPR